MSNLLCCGRGRKPRWSFPAKYPHNFANDINEIITKRLTKST
jgi:hypothetical protein